jgi:hypothetical protein
MSFHAHVELLRLFLAHRNEIVERIQGLLNAQRRPIQEQQDSRLLSRHFEDCFFTLPAVTSDQFRLKGQLERAHWASGFRPRETPGLHNDLVHPAEMTVRAFHLWRQTHWPGHSGRLRYAHTLFNLYGIRQLALLIMRIWDDAREPAEARAEDRLAEVQSLLDQLWKTTPADHPVLVRDARWLIPVAQSPTTDELSGYFDVARHIAETLPEDDRIEIHKAGVCLAGGHLRSQIRHVSTQKNLSVNEGSLVLSTRRSNTLDLATLIQGLVPLLEAYEHADGTKRLELAGAICQGISPDPELFVNRLDLLGPYSMIEHLFITTDAGGNAVYSPMGTRHVQLLHEYEERMRRLSERLYADCLQFRPVAGAYSPYGVLYGFSSNLIEHMAFKTLQPDAETRFSLEDAFTDGDARKLAWVSGWRTLPHIKPEMAKLFEYPQQFAEDIFARIEQAFRKRVSGQTGRLILVPGENLQSDPEVLLKYDDQKQLLDSRLEGEFLVSYKTSGGWVAISKDILTEVLGTGRDVKIVGLPGAAAGVLKLMCPRLVG